MEEDFDLPLSIEELAATRILLYPKLSFLDIMKRYSNRVVDVWHADFTHKCTCPLHGKGLEKTPSFYFSEKSKTYKCFACNGGGNIFDLVGIMEGRPWFYVVKDMLDDSNLDPDQIDFSELGSRPVRSDIVHNVNFDLSIALRDYLASVKNSPIYKEEEIWVDWMFRRIDDHLENLDDSEQEAAASFRITIEIELERRKARAERIHADRNYR